MSVAMYLIAYFLIGLGFVGFVKPTNTNDQRMGEVPPSIWFFIWPFALLIVGLHRGGAFLDGKLARLHGALRRDK